MPDQQNIDPHHAPAEWVMVIRSPLVVIAFAAMVCVLVLMYVLYRDSQRQAFEASVKTLETLVFALSEHVEGTFDIGDQMLKEIRHTYRTPGGDVSSLFEAHNASIDRQSFPLEAVIRADGQMYLSSTKPRDLEGAARVDLSDRAHYRWHLDAKSDEVFVSRPIVGRVSGKPVLNMSRRIDDASGKLLGVAVVSVSPDNFVSPYRNIVGESGVVSIYGRDGIGRVRITRTKVEASTDISKTQSFARLIKDDKGHFVTVSEVDGQPRLYAFRSLKKFPLIVVVGFGLRELEDQHDNGELSRTPVRAALVILGMGLLMGLAVWSQVLRRRLQASNQALEKIAGEAIGTSLARSRFIASISQYMRNPVNSVAVQAQLMALDAPTVAMREDARRIFAHAQSLRRVVDDLRDLAWADSEARVMQWEAASIHPLIREAAMPSSEAATLKGLHVIIQCELPQDAEFVTDAACLKRVLGNLLDNVVEFSARGQIILRVTQMPTGMRFEISGSGIGAPAGGLASIFLPYGVSSKLIDGRQPDVDLGLALAKRFVECLGGTLQMSSGASAGATFWLFELPLRTAQGAGVAART